MAERARGRDLLAELGSAVEPRRLERILREFGALAGDDRSSRRLREATGGEVDLALPAHRLALLTWLRAWGCRHRRVADTRLSSRSLAAWWAAWAASLPDPVRELVSMSEGELDAAAAACGALAASPAARPPRPGGRARVRFGETAAAKALFAIRPLAFAPWDAPIRVALGLEARGAAGYRAYLSQSAEALRALADRLGVPVAEVPSALWRPGSTPPKLVDEYLWMRVRGRG